MHYDLSTGTLDLIGLVFNWTSNTSSRKATKGTPTINPQAPKSRSLTINVINVTKIGKLVALAINRGWRK